MAPTTVALNMPVLGVHPARPRVSFACRLDRQKFCRFIELKIETLPRPRLRQRQAAADGAQGDSIAAFSERTLN